MPKSPRRKRRNDSTDPRVFRFTIRCRHCDKSFNTLQDVKQHVVYDCPWEGDTSIQCGCCDGRFSSWPLCVAHLNRKGAHLRPSRDVVTVSSSSDEGGSPTVKASVSSTSCDSPVAGPSPEPDPASGAAPAALTSMLSISSLPSLTVSECDAAVQAIDASEPPRQLAVGVGDATDSVWRRRFYMIARHLLLWVQESADPQSTSGQTLGNGELLRNCPFSFDAAAPMQQLAGEVLPYFQLLANEDVDPGL